MSNCRRLVRLEAEANRLGKIVFPDGQISDDLFVPFAHQTICSSETICSSSSVKTAIWRRCFFLDGGKPEYSEKNPRNQEQTQATYGMAPGRNRTQATSVEGGALTTAPSLLPQMSIKMVQKHFSFVFVSIFPRPGQCCDSRFTSNAKMRAKSNSLVTQDKQARLVVLHLPAR